MRAERGGRAAVALIAVALTLAACTSPIPDDGATATPSPSASPSTSSPTSSATPTDAPSATETATTAEPSASPTVTPTPTATPTSEPTATVAPSQDDGSAGATVVVSWSGVSPDGEVQASGYVQVLEQGGTCRLDVTGADGTTAYASLEAIPDASTTSCGELNVPADQAGPGPWQAQLSYSSGTSSGSSARFEIAAP